MSVRPSGPFWGESDTVTYFRDIWRARYFWTHLSFADLRARWRRSFLGMAWMVIQPLGMTLLIATVFGRIFDVEIREYAPYILSGMIIWEFVTASAIGGALAFVQSDAYIKQCRHPLAIYTLRTVLTNLIVCAAASLSLVLWVLVAMPQHFGWSWLAAVTVFPVLGLLGWPMATFLAYIATRFRDIPHAMGLMLQAVWFLSPIYFESRVFRGAGLDWLVDYNPIFHLLELVRAPLLRGEWPTGENYLFCALAIGVVTTLAVALGMRAEKNVIFYL